MADFNTVEVIKYNSGLKQEWDIFIQKAINGHFLFYRNYMEYHSVKYPDNSLLFYINRKLYAVFPASVKQKVLISHPGLTFGGFIVNKNISLNKTQLIYKRLIEFSLQNGYTAIVYKAIPYIYHRFPFQEDLFVLFNNGAKLIQRDLGSVLEPKKMIKLSKGRTASINRAKKCNLTLCQSQDFKTYMGIVSSLLKEKYSSVPVHSYEELEKLALHFPEHIKLFVTKKGENIIAGAVIYETEDVAHCQYIASSDEGKELKALDLLFDNLVGNLYKMKKYFDFGTSIARNKEQCNRNLVRYKESYGGRGVVYDTYRIVLI